MKRICNILAAACIFNTVYAGMLYAHCGMCSLSKEDGDWVEKKVQKMTENLGLSQEQAAQMRVLMNEKMEKKKAIQSEKSDALEAVKEEYSAKIKALLTDEQKVKYEVMMKGRAANGMKGSGHDHEHKGSHGEMKGSDYENKGS